MESVVDMLTRMSEGNPGAVNVIMNILENGNEIDPDSALGAAAHVWLLDENKVHGSRIWMLAKDVCGQDLSMTLAVIRSLQLGFITIEQFNHAIDNRGEGIDLTSLREKVEKVLPNFKRMV